MIRQRFTSVSRLAAILASGNLKSAPMFAASASDAPAGTQSTLAIPPAEAPKFALVELR